MRLRRVRLVEGGECAAVWDEPRERWLPLVPALAAVGDTDETLSPYANDIVGLLAGGTPTRDALTALCERVVNDDFQASFETTPLLPFQPRLMRAFANSEQHWIQGARGHVRSNLPRVWPLIRFIEAITRRPFPPFRPKKLFYEHPTYYISNALTFVPDGATAPWPSYTSRLDFEIELGAVIVRPLLNASHDEATAAIGGFVVINDLSARDTQWHEIRHGLFGPVIKSKTFASAMSAEIVSADEVLPRLRDLGAEVRVNGEIWSRTGTQDMKWDFGEMVAHASEGEHVFPGELISAGTLTNGCGLELNRWLKPNDQLELKIEGVATLRNEIGTPGGA